MDPSKPNRHYGTLTTTGTRLIVIFKSMPGAPDKALVCSPDAMTTALNNDLMRVVESPEGQNAENLYDLLARKGGTNIANSILEALHHSRYLFPVPIDNVDMRPKHGLAIPLRKVLESLNQIVPPKQETPVVEKFNPYQANIDATNTNEAATIAGNLIFEAAAMEQEANALLRQADQRKEKAYAMCPQLKPKAVQTFSADPYTDNSVSVTAPSKPKRVNTRKKAEK